MSDVKGLKKEPFVFEPMATQADVRAAIKSCEGRHVQQVCYSSFMDTLTQICFTCQCIRSTVRWFGSRSWNGDTGVNKINGAHQ